MDRLRSVSPKKLLVVLPLLMAIIVMAVLQVQGLRDQLTSGRTGMLVKTVGAAYAQVANFHQLVINGDMTDTEGRAAALRVLREMRHSTSEYFWVSDYNGRLVMHPIEPALEGELLRSMGGDGDDRVLHEEIARVLRQQGGGFLTYRWPKPGSEVAVEKISYVQGFAPWGWGIGSGVYVDDIDQALWVEMKTLIQIFLILLAVLVAFWFGFHKVIFPRKETMAGYRG